MECHGAESISRVRFSPKLPQSDLAIFFGAVEDEVRLKEGTGEYLEECRPLSRVAWYDCGREVRQDGTQVAVKMAWDVVWISPAN